MKRYLAIVLLTALVLALCLPIIARYEICAYCQSARLQRQTEKTTDWCDTCGKNVSAVHVYMYCPNCTHTEDWGIELNCGH